MILTKEAIEPPFLFLITSYWEEGACHEGYFSGIESKTNNAPLPPNSSGA